MVIIEVHEEEVCEVPELRRYASGQLTMLQTQNSQVAETAQVGAQKSELKLLDFEADPESRFQALVTSLPVPPLEVALEGDAEAIAIIQASLAESTDKMIE